ncbi:MAG: putative polymerase sigma factor containing a repeat domain [Myxococcaceae bacterium]|nr:putative polymerase sigma factor containing a repeat domain [Myxococcaceae bacterium]
MSSEECEAHANRAAEAVARRSYGKLVALLASQTHDVEAAEDALAEAFASALEHWPTRGSPSNPEAWLLAAARRKGIDAARRRRTAERATSDVQLLAEELGSAAASDTPIPDHRLGLMFACAHPSIEIGIRAPLMLQAVLGLDAKRIASAFLTSPGTMGQRLARAKKKIRRAGIPFRIPERQELSGRLDTVLDAIYAIFAEGWADYDGSDVVRRDLAEEALFLGTLVTELVPEAAEAFGLLALMLYVEARRGARRDQSGAYVPLTEQDPVRWDSSMIEEAEARLLRARGLGPIGRYQFEAALQSAHVFRCRTGTPNWQAVMQLYDALFVLTGSPVVAVNRALVIAELGGARAGLEAIEQIADARLAEYQPYWAARAALLARADRRAEARHAYDVAIGLERDPAVRRFLQERRRAVDSPQP